MIGFLKNLYLRPPCHAYLFSSLPRVADFSLGDFWGISSTHPEWDNDKGTSLVILSTIKAQEVINFCRADLLFHDVDLDLAIKYNPCICGSVKTR